MGRNELENAKFSVDSLHYVNQLNSLVPDKYDYISLSYTGTSVYQAIYKIDGGSGTTVATLTLGYDVSDNLTSVTKS